MIAKWLTGIGTIALAVVATFQDTIRQWFYRPELDVFINTSPPNCLMIPMTYVDGAPPADVLFIRLWVGNSGNATARNVEIYANELLRRRADLSWERVNEFTPMNLKWSHTGQIYFPLIVPGMGKHCDIGHIIDPAKRGDSPLDAESPRLNLTSQETSLSFDLMVSPNHKGHIVGPGHYQLKIIIAAENAPRVERTLSISLQGTWYPDEGTMLRDGVGVVLIPLR